MHVVKKKTLQDFWIRHRLAELPLRAWLKDAERAKQLFENLAKGGTVVMPLEKTYWAEAFGMVTDKFGVKWMINCEAAK